MSNSEARTERVLELAEEFLARYRNGERPPLKEYLDRHPDLAADIREVFPAMAMMENIAVADESIEQGGAAKTASSQETPVRQLGDYRIIREIGHGGMGVVYEAEQVSLGRHVALKLLPNHALQDAKQKLRFEREAKAAAKLHHTNIVPVFGVGDHDGVPYYVMQFIQGLSLDAVLDELNRMQAGDPATPIGLPAAGEIRVTRRDVSAAEVARSLMTGVFERSGDDGATGASPPLPPVDAAADLTAEGAVSAPTSTTSGAGRLSDAFTVSSSSLSSPSSSGAGRKTAARKPTYWHSVANIGRQVAEALEYAHKQGVLHRDVKPSNLLFDLRGTVWVTDFGLAKVAGPAADNLTHTGDILGTLRYMPPEAFEGKSDARSDVYSLGLTLYELLAMRPAFDERERNKLIKRVTSGEPTPLDSVRRDIPRDLVTIVQKSIAREPGRRYASAELLASDLQRFLDDEPIQARRQTNLERAVRWARHNPGIAVLGGVLTAVLVLATVVSLLAAGYFNQLRHEEADAAQQARNARNDALTSRHASQVQSAELLLDRGLSLAEQGEAAVGLHWMLESLNVAPDDAVDLRRVILTNLGTWSEQVHGLWRILPLPPKQVGAVAFSPDGKTFVTGTDDGLQLWNADTFERIGKPFGRQNEVFAAVFSPDGKTLLTAYNGAAQRWDVATGAAVGEPFAHRGIVRGVAFSPDGEVIATASEDRTARLWDAAAGKPMQPPLQHDMAVLSVAFSPDGKSLLTSVGPAYLEPESTQGAAYIWDVATGKQLGPTFVQQRGVLDAAFSPDDLEILTGGVDRTARLWDRATAAPKNLPLSHRSGVQHVGFTPDGAAIITGCHYAFRAYLWDRFTGQRQGTPLWHREALFCFAQSPDGKVVLTAGADNTIRVWRMSRNLSRPFNTTADAKIEAGPTRKRALGPEESLPDYLLHRLVEYTADRKTVLTIDGTTTAQLRDTHTGRPIGAPLRHGRPIRTFAFSPDGTRVATSSHDMFRGDGAVQVWDAATGRPVAPAMKTGWVAALAFSPDGRLLVTGDYARQVRSWDVATGKPVGPVLAHPGVPFQVKFSPDGKTLAVSMVDSANEARLWDVATGRPLGMPMPHKNWVIDVAFSPDGKALLTRSNDRTVRVWDAATGEPVTAYLPHQGLRTAAFSPDGKTIATGGDDDTTQLWDAATGQPIKGGTLTHESRVLALAFSPDGRYLATGCADGGGRLWDLTTFKSLGPAFALRGEIVGVTFTPDGRSVLTTAADGATRLWPVPEPWDGDVERITLRLQVRTGMHMDASQVVLPLDPVVWEERRRRLADLDGSTEGAYRSSVDDWAYHNARAQDAEQDGAAFVALWHLDRLAALQPKDWLPLARRGRVHSTAGRFDKADADYRAATQLASPAVLTDWYRQRVAECEAAGQDAAKSWYQARVVAAEPNDRKTLEEPDLAGGKSKFLAVIRGEAKSSDNAERIGFAQLAFEQKKYASAARLWDEALKSDPKLGDDRNAQHRYNAACAAALAAAGRARGEPPLDAAAQTRLRRQALDWLKADLAVWREVLQVIPPENAPLITDTLGHWQTDGDLAGVRDAVPLSTLPADERKSFTQLWSDVALLLKAANAKWMVFLQQQLLKARKTLAKDNPELALMQSLIAKILMEEERWAEAEPLLRESVAIGEKSLPNAWTTFYEQSLLGGSLIGQKKYAEAEPLLLKGYEGMMVRERMIPAVEKHRLSEALDRLIAHYTATNQPDEVKKWRAERVRISTAAPSK